VKTPRTKEYQTSYSGILENKYKATVFPVLGKLPQNICKNIGELGFQYFNYEKHSVFQINC